jgi:hypothetical protein
MWHQARSFACHYNSAATAAPTSSRLGVSCGSFVGEGSGSRRKNEATASPRRGGGRRKRRFDVPDEVASMTGRERVVPERGPASTCPQCIHSNQRARVARAVCKTRNQRRLRGYGGLGPATWAVIQRGVLSAKHGATGGAPTTLNTMTQRARSDAFNVAAGGNNLGRGHPPSGEVTG